MEELESIVYTPSIVTCLHCWRETAVRVRGTNTLNVYYCAACNATRYVPEERV